MYIRTKRRITKKDYDIYAYEAKSIRTKEGPRQKVVSYLGKVHKFENNGLTLPFYLSEANLQTYFSDKNLKETVKELLIFELIRHGFSRDGNILTKNEFIVNIDDKTVKSKTKENIVFSINQGFLCTETLKKCLKCIEESSETKKLIKSLLLIGLSPDQDSFTQIFEGKI